MSMKARRSDFVECAAQEGVEVVLVPSRGYQKYATIPEVVCMFELRNSVVDVAADLYPEYVYGY